MPILTKHENLPDEHSEGPDVGPDGVTFTLEHLGGHEIRGVADGSVTQDVSRYLGINELELLRNRVNDDVISSELLVEVAKRLKGVLQYTVVGSALH